MASIGFTVSLIATMAKTTRVIQKPNDVIDGRVTSD